MWWSYYEDPDTEVSDVRRRMLNKKQRVLSINEAYAWKEEVLSLEQAWLDCEISTKRAKDFTDWAVPELLDRIRVAGCEHEGNHYSLASNRPGINAAQKARDVAWDHLQRLHWLFRCLSCATSGYGGDDASVVRRALLASQESLEQLDQGGSRWKEAEQLRHALGVPTDIDIDTGEVGYDDNEEPTL